ncbi:MAG: radical SAM protein [Kiritimatiellae bacterium]|nr:radical SAM protein [Kiritimatiellia bacterium]
MAKFFGRRMPLAVSWLLTARCNARCAYCAIWRLDSEELTTQEVLKTLRTMRRMGTLRVNFGGGEPLMRDDIGAILAECRRLGIGAAVNTNGILVPDRIEDLKTLTALNISLDGPAPVHDAIRGKGSHAAVLRAARLASDRGIPIRFLCTISSRNSGELGHVLELAGNFNADALFQPATATRLYGEAENPLRPDPESFRKSVAMLLAAKRAGAPVANSRAGLLVLGRWPDLPVVPCAGGRVFCAVEPAGYVKICNDMRCHQARYGIRETGFRRAFRNLPRIPGCARCECAALLEINLAFALNPDAVRHLRIGTLA